MRVLTPEIVERDLSKHIEKQLVNSLSDLPRTERFYGRETEITNCSDSRTSICDPSGSNCGWKTPASRLIEEFTHKEPSLPPVSGRDGSRPFLDAMGEWLLQIGHSDLAGYLDAGGVAQVVSQQR